MYAIVLSFDQRSPFVDLLLKSYEVYYPNCPFIFRVPYNNGLRHEPMTSVMGS